MLLRRRSLRNNGVGDGGGTALSNALRFNSTLTHLLCVCPRESLDCEPLRARFAHRSRSRMMFAAWELRVLATQAQPRWQGHSSSTTLFRRWSACANANGCSRGSRARVGGARVVARSCVPPARWTRPPCQRARTITRPSSSNAAPRLPNNKIGGRGVEALCTALRINTRVHHVKYGSVRLPTSLPQLECVADPLLATRHTPTRSSCFGLPAVLCRAQSHEQSNR